jgi:hypothetical protein
MPLLKLGRMELGIAHDQARLAIGHAAQLDALVLRIEMGVEKCGSHQGVNLRDSL